MTGMKMMIQMKIGNKEGGGRGKKGEWWKQNSRKAKSNRDNTNKNRIQ